MNTRSSAPGTAHVSAHRREQGRDAEPSRALPPSMSRVFVLQKTVGNRAVVSLLRDARTGAGEVATEAVVQRKIGFEYQTGWTARMGGGLLKKFDRIGKSAYSGFKVESDDDGEVEFITTPIEIGPSLVGRLGLTFDGLDAFAQALIQVARDTRTRVASPEDVDSPDVMEVEVAEEEDDDDSAGSGDDLNATFDYVDFSLESATENPQDAAFVIRPKDVDMQAKPQTTAGLSLDQIAKLPTREAAFAGAATAAGQTATQPAASFFSRQLAAAKLERAAISDELAGLLMLLGSYLSAGQLGPFEYPKIISDRWLLARNDFVTLLTQVPEAKDITADPSFFADLVIGCVNVARRDLDIPVYVYGLHHPDRVDPPGSGIPFGPTRGEWLRGLATGTDLLAHASNPEFESMGKMGKATERVATEDGGVKAGGIFEFRGGQNVKIAQRHWRAYATDMAAAIASFQQDPTGTLEREEFADAFEIFQGAVGLVGLKRSLH